MKLSGPIDEFIVVGENVHCTRVILRRDDRIVDDGNGHEAIRFEARDGGELALPIPEEMKHAPDYLEGRIKHVQAAVRSAMEGNGATAAAGRDYLDFIVQSQVLVGVDFLDLNVDEISPSLDHQIATMRWLVATVQSLSSVPLSIDSSKLEIIKAGLTVCDGAAGRPLLNSASLERIDALDLAVEHNAHVIVTAAGVRGMPADDEERVRNASQIVELALEKGIAASDIQVDLLVFPVAVDQQYPLHYLDAVRGLRATFGSEIHITGGISNVSFGLPGRRLVNDVFLNLAVEAGADAGIVDATPGGIQAILDLDRESDAYRLTREMLLGEDPDCKQFLKAWRRKEIAIP